MEAFDRYRLCIWVPKVLSFAESLRRIVGPVLLGRSHLFLKPSSPVAGTLSYYVLVRISIHIVQQERCCRSRQVRAPVARIG